MNINSSMNGSININSSMNSSIILMAVLIVIL